MTQMIMRGNNRTQRSRNSPTSNGVDRHEFKKYTENSYMKIKYSPHARKRLKERSIVLAHVRATLLRPDLISRADRDRTIVRKKLKGKTLEVIYIIENNEIMIVTLYYL